jgi:SAM-dependent methyltransferase
MSARTLQQRAVSVETAERLWKAVIDPAGIGMANAIASDIAAYTGEPLDVVLRRMASGKEDFRELWCATVPDAGDAERVESFYRSQFVEAYELANWHVGLTSGAPPHAYARAALLAQQRGLRRVLDFGSGIGTGSLAFASVGCEVHSADIAQGLLRFAGFRLQKHGYQPRLIDLAAGERPAVGYFDFIACFDVLEHVPDQFAKLMELSGFLRPGGLLMVNLMDDSSDPDRPMHISSAGDWLALVRRTNLVPEWTEFLGGVEVLQKRRFGRGRNRVGALVDRLQGATGASLMRHPRTA